MKEAQSFSVRTLSGGLVMSQYAAILCRKAEVSSVSFLELDRVQTHVEV